MAKKDKTTYVVRVQTAYRKFVNLHFHDFESASQEYHHNPAACVFRWRDVAGEWHVVGYKQPDLGV